MNPGGKQQHNKIKVIIVEDHTIVREGLKLLLEVGEEIEVIGEAKDGFSCIDMLEKGLRPDIIFMDIRMPGISGIEATRLIMEKYQTIRIVMLTIYKDDHYIADSIRAGAKGYILKNVGRDDLMALIHQVMQEGACMDPAIATNIVSCMTTTDKDQTPKGKLHFTQRELEVLKGMVIGNTNRMISQSLFISEQTVKTHMKNIFKKLGVNSKSQAVVRAIQENIINPYTS